MLITNATCHHCCVHLTKNIIIQLILNWREISWDLRVSIMRMHAIYCKFSKCIFRRKINSLSPVLKLSGIFFNKQWYLESHLSTWQASSSSKRYDERLYLHRWQRYYRVDVLHSEVLQHRQWCVSSVFDSEWRQWHLKITRKVSIAFDHSLQQNQIKWINSTYTFARRVQFSYRQNISQNSPPKWDCEIMVNPLRKHNNQ